MYGIKINKLSKKKYRETSIQDLVFLPKWFFKTKNSEAYQQFLNNSYHLPLKEGVVLHFKKLAFPYPSDALC